MQVYKPRNRKWDIVRIGWGAIWVVPLCIAMLLVRVIARIGFGK